MLIRVCMICEEKKGTAYRYLSIHGCKDDTTTRSCKYCKSFLHCQIRLVNPDPKEVTHGYCEACMDKFYERLARERE